MKPISKETEAALFKEFQSGNEDSFTQILNQFQPLAVSVVQKFMGIDYNHLQPDLESDVHLILWNAAKHFDVTKGHRFSSYLRQCVIYHIWRTIKAGRKEREHIENYWHTIPDASFKNITSDGDCEVLVTDSFACRDEPILTELTPFCEGENQKRLLKLICTDEDIWYKNGHVNYSEIGRKLDTSGEAVRQIISKLRSNRNLKSALCELVPR